MKNLIFLLFFVEALLAADPNENSDSTKARWATPELWEAKLCENMNEGKVLSILGPPLLILYKGTGELYWFYQERPSVHEVSGAFSKEKSKYIKKKVELPEYGYVYFTKNKKVLKDPYSQNSKNTFPFKNKTPSRGNPIINKPVEEFCVNLWKSPEWSMVAHYGAKEHSKDFRKMVRNPETKFQNTLNWRKIEQNMPIEKVEAILGKPLFDERERPGERIWYYTDIDHYGTISFGVKKDSPEYVVRTWQEPFWPEYDSDQNIQK